MKYCPNPGCSFYVRHGRAGEYVDSVGSCSDCGAALAAEGPPPAPAPPARSLPWRRIGVSLLALLLAGALLRVPIPWMPVELGSDVVGFANSVGVLGIMPFVSSFVLVELWSVAFPGQARRRESAEGRAVLWSVSLRLGVVLAFIQAFSVTQTLNQLLGHQGASLGWDTLTQAGVTLSLVGATCLFALLARWIDRAGLGSGFLLLLGLTQGTSLLRVAWSLEQYGPRPSLMGWLSLLAVVVATWAVTRPPAPGRLRAGAAGLLPWSLGLWAGGLLLLITRWILPNLAGFVERLVPFATIVLAPFVGVWVQQPRRVAAVREGLGLGAATGDGRWGSLLFAMLLVLPIGVAGRDGAAFLSFPSTLAMLTVIGLELWEELQFRVRVPDAIEWIDEGRTYAADAQMEALAGVPAFARGLRYRALTHVFGAFVPIVVLTKPQAGPT